ncbi:MAG: DUF1573 domain-containing protein [bacterium]|nr:DUF1573 domain-containing protein [bacterium]
MLRRCLLLLGGAAIMAAPLAFAQALAPRVVIEAPVHDFGTVEEGAAVEHVFRVRNDGTDWLRVEQVKGTCGCTVGAAAGTLVAPGSETTVLVTLDTRRLAGRTTKTVTVYTNDPVSPRLGLTVTGDVLTDLVIAPQPLYLGRLRRGERVRREVRIAPGRPGGTAQVVLVEQAPQPLRVLIEPGDDPGEQKLVVDVVGELPLGRFNDEVVLRTTSAARPVVRLPVMANVQGDLAILPPQVTFDVARDGSAEPHDVRIRNLGRNPLAVTGVTAPDPVAWELTTLRPGAEWKLTLRLRGPLVSPLAGEVEVLTTHPIDARVVIPVYSLDRSQS